MRVPSKRRLTRVPLCCDDSECKVKVGALFDIKVTAEGDTDGRSKHGRCTIDRSASLCMTQMYSQFSPESLVGLM